MILNEELSQVSLLFVYGAMAFYTFAFLAFVAQLSRLASTKQESRATATGVEKLGIWLLIIAALGHGAGVVLRGISANRVPWANMYEFSITGSFIVIMIYLLALRIREVRLIATFISGFTLLVLGLATSVWYVQVKTLMPALQSYWLVIHVLVAVLATAFFTIAAALADLVAVDEQVNQHMNASREAHQGRGFGDCPRSTAHDSERGDQFDVSPAQIRDEGKHGRTSSQRDAALRSVDESARPHLRNESDCSGNRGEREAVGLRGFPEQLEHLVQR